MITITKSWFKLLEDEFKKDYFLTLQNFLKEEYNNKTIYPSSENIFNALNFTSFENVKVVILGQDPYHQPNQAHGLCFSVLEGVNLPPSLNNIFKEIETELEIKCERMGNLSRWAKQGILLLNTVLTVEASKPNSHFGKGWEVFTKKIVQILNERSRPIIFVLWGANAKSFETMIDASRHIVLKCAHPSPLSAYNGFFGCGHFKKINELLTQWGEKPIDWR